MDWILIIILVILIAWLVMSVFVNNGWLRFKKGGAKENGNISQTPYEKYLAEHATSWQMSWERKEVVKHKLQLTEALKRGDQTAVKIQRSMLVFGRSLVNYLQEKFKNL